VITKTRRSRVAVIFRSGALCVTRQAGLDGVAARHVCCREVSELREVHIRQLARGQINHGACLCLEVVAPCLMASSLATLVQVGQSASCCFRTGDDVMRARKVVETYQSMLKPMRSEVL
jgi:hypothetical protein